MQVKPSALLCVKLCETTVHEICPLKIMLAKFSILFLSLISCLDFSFSYLFFFSFSFFLCSLFSLSFFGFILPFQVLWSQPASWPNFPDSAVLAIETWYVGQCLTFLHQLLGWMKSVGVLWQVVYIVYSIDVAVEGPEHACDHSCWSNFSSIFGLVLSFL